MFGTVISLTVTVLVFIILSEKMLDMVYMRDPTVKVNRRPILKKEFEDAGVVNLSDLDLQIGFAVKHYELNYDKGAYDFKRAEPLPEGLLVSNTAIDGVTSSPSSSAVAPLVSCKDLILDIVDLSEDHLAMIEVGSCADPQLTSVQGTQVYDEDWLMHNFRFDKDYLEKDRYLYMFYSFNIFDS